MKNCLRFLFKVDVHIVGLLHINTTSIQTKKSFKEKILLGTVHVFYTILKNVNLLGSADLILDKFPDVINKQSVTFRLRFLLHSLISVPQQRREYLEGKSVKSWHQSPNSSVIVTFNCSYWDEMSLHHCRRKLSVLCGHGSVLVG